MIIALLALLGVSLWAIVVLAALMVARRRWLAGQPGAVPCAIRAVDGDVARVGGRRWRRGWARRADGLLVWDPMPSPFGSSVLEVLDVIDQRPAEPGEVRRLGERPAVLQLRLRSGATIAVALRDEHAASVRGSDAARRPSERAGG